MQSAAAREDTACELTRSPSPFLGISAVEWEAAALNLSKKHAIVNSGTAKINVCLQQLTRFLEGVAALG
jgi:hypothetical protein